MVFDILNDLVSIPSPSGNEQEIASYIYDFLESCNFELVKQHVEGTRYNIIGKKGHPNICFFGHMDTVPPCDNWSTDPFTPVHKNNKVYGLGTWDMKAGLAVILSIAKRAENMAVAFTVDEENISLGGWKLVEEKGFFRDIRLVVSAESGNTPNVDGGVPNIALGRYGRIVINAEKRFGAGHSANTDDEWVDYLYALKYNKFREHLKIRVEDISILARGFSNPDRISLKASVLMHPDLTDVDAVLSELFDSYSLAERKTPYLMPYRTRVDDYVKRAEYLLSFFGKPNKVIAHSVGDENAIATLGVPIIIVGTKGGNEHAADEWVDKRSVLMLENYYGMLLNAF